MSGWKCCLPGVTNVSVALAASMLARVAVTALASSVWDSVPVRDVGGDDLAIDRIRAVRFEKSVGGADGKSPVV